jgi:hypothetical protein
MSGESESQAKVGEEIEYQSCYVVNKHPAYAGVVVCCWYADVRRLTHQNGIRLPGVVVQRKAGLREALKALEERVQYKLYAIPRSQEFKGPVVVTNSLDYLGIVRDLDGGWKPNTFSKTFEKGDVDGCAGLLFESLRRIREIVERNRSVANEGATVGNLTGAAEGTGSEVAIAVDKGDVAANTNVVGKDGGADGDTAGLIVSLMGPGIPGSREKKKRRME